MAGKKKDKKREREKKKEVITKIGREIKWQEPITEENYFSAN